MSNFGEQRTKQEVELTRGRRTCRNGGDLLEDGRISRGAWKTMLRWGQRETSWISDEKLRWFALAGSMELTWSQNR